MLSIITTLLGFADPITKIVGKIVDLRAQQTNAATEVEKAAIGEEIAALQARRDVLIAESSSRVNPFMRALIAIGPALFICKVFLFDKVLGAFVGCNGDTSTMPGCRVFSTDALDPNLWFVVTAVLSFYLLTTNRLFR
jgi:hypothetical protein